MPLIDLRKVRLVPLSERRNKVSIDAFARAPELGRSLAEFVDSLPHLMAADDFRRVVQSIVSAHRGRHQVVVAMGAHVIKCGLSPVIIRLMEHGVITAIALNGAGAIHDCEIALIGETSEDVGAGLKDGSFGMARETGELINGAVHRVWERPGAGFGELVGEKLLSSEAPFGNFSILAVAHRLGIPATVHVAIGTDIVHMHPSADGGAIGKASYNDFKIFAGVIRELTGGVYLNVGSAVVLPEVFLKAFAVAQNLGANLRDFVTANMDMIPHYRATENVTGRPPSVGGEGFTLIGRHEIMIPLLGQAIVDSLGGQQ